MDQAHICPQCSKGGAPCCEQLTGSSEGSSCFGMRREQEAGSRTPAATRTLLLDLLLRQRKLWRESSGWNPNSDMDQLCGPEEISSLMKLLSPNILKLPIALKVKAKGHR